jgi:multicomponent Na+:H+ antiporter subunit B
VTSLILQTTARLLQPLMVLLSLFLLLRGHNQPGGGFVGGLVVAAAFGLHSMAFGVRSARDALRVDPRSLIAWGGVLAVATALLPLALGKPFFSAVWIEARLGEIGVVELGTPLAFDAGVYLLVAGATLSALFALEEDVP